MARRRDIDVAIVQDVKQIQNALELFFLANRNYPIGLYVAESIDNDIEIETSGADLTASLSSYIKTFPKLRHLELGGLLYYDGTSTQPYRCNSNDYTTAGAPRYIIMFSSHFPLRFSFASALINSNIITYNGNLGSPKYYCVSGNK